MDHTSIETFVTDRYPHLALDMLHDLIAAATVYLGERGLTGVNDSITPSLSKHLADHHERVKSGRDISRNWRELYFSEIPAPFDADISDDEKISPIARETIFDKSKEVKEELEESAVAFELQKESLRFLLPLPVFEALERRLRPETAAHWTTGFEQSGLSILFRRARVRMAWEDYE